MTQTQLAAIINRTGKYISEVETGKARLSEAETNKLAEALGVAVDKILKADPVELAQQVNDLPRRIRESQPTGLVVFAFQQLIDHLDRAGWLRNCTIWNVSSEPFPEENNVTLVEQLGELAATRAVRLIYVYPRTRIPESSPKGEALLQGTAQALPASLMNALGWSDKLRDKMEMDPQTVRGYGLESDFPFFSSLHSHLWIETADTSWSEVMPLLYGRAETRTHENSNASVPFLYHVPRDRGSRMLITLAQRIKAIDRRPVVA
jgi:transcriptional regulator with XRE-family HTH domain